VFVFRMWRNTGYGWDPEPLLRVHVSAEGSGEPFQLSWVAVDGRECCVGFAPDLAACRGHRRLPDGRVVMVRGEFDRREGAPESVASGGYVFDTEVLDPQWHSAGRLQVLIDDGTQPRLRWVAWSDRSGGAYSAAIWSPDFSGEPDFFTAGGLRIRLATSFEGYRQPAGGGPVIWRGVQINGVPADTPAVTEVEQEPVVLEAVPPGTPLLPPVTSVPLVRTDFSENRAWVEVSSEVTAERHLSGGDVFSADVDLVDDGRFDGLSRTQLCQLVPPGVQWRLLLVADRATMASPERHVLVVDLDEDSLGRSFRATPAAIQEIENNLSLWNMDWEDFAFNADAGGIVRPRLA
jgi:OAA-family lectin sugar binding domain